MKKSEYLLAQKTLAAREIKVKSQQIKEELQVMKTTAINNGMKNKKGNISSSTEYLLNSPTMKKSNTLPSLNSDEYGFTNKEKPSSAANNFQFNDSIPKLQSARSVDNLQQMVNNGNQSGRNSVSGSNPHRMSAEALAMVEELSKRTVTDKTNLRKLQYQVSMSLEKGHTNTSNASTTNNESVSNNANTVNNNLPPSRQLSSRHNHSSQGNTNNFSNNTNNINSTRRPSTTNSYNTMFSNNNNSSSTVRLTAIPETTANSTPSNSNKGVDWTNTNIQDFTSTNATPQNHGSTTTKAKGKDENYFMPKKKTLRSDGATLLDVYLSKKEDMWGKILHAQIKEDDIIARQQRKKKEEDDRKYGSLLKGQVVENMNKHQEELKENEYFAKLEHQTATKYDDLEKRRAEDAIRRHKQFISNAIEDMHTKHQKKQQDFREDLTASSIMVNNAKDQLAMEEEKKKEEREFHRRYQEQMFQENLDNIARKQNSKLASFAEDKRVNLENERQFQREQQRREMELSKRMELSSEGPAHFIVEAIVKRKRAEDDKFFNDLITADNNLNKQLKASEDGAKAREKSNGVSVTEEWLHHKAIKEALMQEEEQRNAKILNTMRKMLADQEEEDKRRRQQKNKDAMRYQQELDAQVTALRQRSIDQLQKTMSEQEVKYNSDLIQKTSKFL